MGGSVRALLGSHGFVAKKSLGQNFLTDARIAERIIAAANVSRETLVVEIGPGTGALTQLLAKAAAQVFAIELDDRLIAILNETIEPKEHVSLVHADALDVDFDALLSQHTTTTEDVVFMGNLPYYITSHAIRKMLETRIRPRAIVLMVQLEVAQRMTAKPDDMNLLAIGVQFYGQPELLFKVPPSAFFPSPTVESAVVRIVPHAGELPADPQHLFALARAGFGQPRKQLRNTLAHGLALTREDAAELLISAKIDPTRRPETLSIADWVSLSNLYAKRFPSRA